MHFPNDWRENASSVKDRLNYTLTNENTQQDVVIVVGCGSTETKIKAHSFMLFIGSQVLQRLLEQAKMNNEGMKEIKLSDVRPEAMKLVLRYLYTDAFDVQYEDTLDILYAALKLNLHTLAGLCAAKVKDELSVESVLGIYEKSAKMNVEELVQISQEFILKNAAEVFLQEQFLNITTENLCKLLTFDELEIDEISVFNCIISWAKAECTRSELEESSENLRFVLKKVVPFIRFTLMATNEFSSIVVPTNILDHKEVNDIYTYLGTKTSRPSKQAKPHFCISSYSERKLDRTASSNSSNSSGINQSGNDGILQRQIQPKNTTKEKLLQYLKNISGKNTISGLYIERTDPDRNEKVKVIHRITGVHPGILTLTMPCYLDGATQWQSFTETILSNWNNGYLMRITWWPTGIHPFHSFNTLPDKWNDLIKGNGHLNQVWKKQLDVIVPYFQQLQNAGVVVISDFFPWINNDMAGGSGLSKSLRLYQLTHDYMTEKHNLHSILWTLSLKGSSDITNLKNFWPGNNYVDVVSAYVWSPEEVEKTFYQQLLEIVGDTPISLECLWSAPSPAVLALQPRWTWFTTEISFYESSKNNPIVKTMFESDSIINKENNEFFKTLKFKSVKNILDI